MSRSARSRRNTAGGRLSAEPDDFFAGVDEVRAYLDRNLQDPERRRERLALLARDVVKPRSPHELGVWLCSQVREALGAGGAALLRRDAGWEVWRQDGECPALPKSTDLDRWVPSAARGEREPVQAREGLVVAVVGAEELLGALWIEHGQDLDPGSRVLLQAIVDTAGIALEQARAAEDLARDPETGLHHGEAFVRLMDTVRHDWARANLAAGWVAFRVIVDAALPRAGVSAIEGRRRLARVVAQAMPPGAVLGRSADDVCALVAEADAKQLEHTLAARARAVSAAFGGGAAAVYRVSPATAASREELALGERALSGMGSGGIRRV